MTGMARVILLAGLSLIIFACGKKGPPVLKDYQSGVNLPVDVIEKERHGPLTVINCKGQCCMFLHVVPDRKFTVKG